MASSAPTHTGLICSISGIFCSHRSKSCSLRKNMRCVLHTNSSKEEAAVAWHAYFLFAALASINDEVVCCCSSDRRRVACAFDQPEIDTVGELPVKQLKRQNVRSEFSPREFP